MDIYKELDLLYAEGGDIEAFLRERIAEAEGDAEFIVLYNELGSFLRGVSRYEESATAFEKAAELISEAGDAVSLNFATTMNNLATTYRMMGDNENALKGYEASIAVYRSLPDTTPYHYAGVLNNLSALYLSQGKLEDAAEVSEETISQLERDESLSDELATAKTNLASIYIRLGETDRTEVVLGEALRIFESAGAESAHYPAALNNSAMLKAIRGDYVGAIDIWLRVLEKISRVFGENADYAMTCRNLSRAMLKTGDEAEAKRYMSKAVSLFEKIFGEDDANTESVRLELIGMLKD
jgi:tetratricopeptide (TPR) repeat protein